MANTLIGCGGTGAHVALALTRLHALGDPLGFFRRGSTPMDLPGLYLVDQDSGDGEKADKPTAWQALRQVLEGHPSHTRNGARNTGRRWPSPQAVTPLPVGLRQDFLAHGMTTLERRYPNSDYLACILSSEQRAIEFSRGMMGSPTVGSLLFKLKSYDTRKDDPNINHDEYFHQLCSVQGRVAVVGSGVGGTGAAVGPTLAEQLSGVPERHVMAVMLLNWFKFDETYEHLGKNRISAQRRNRVMSENAHSGLRYYGSRLAEHVATVPVGIPGQALAQRIYSGDNHQPVLEAYPHAVAAICCLRQFLDDDPYSKGLYHLDADDPSRLGSRTGLPGGGTVGDLVARGTTLANTLKTYKRVLGSIGTGYLQPILCEVLGGRRHETARKLAELQRDYSKNLEWLVGMLDGDSPEPIGTSFTREVAVRQRLRDRPLTPHRLGSPDQAASEVFHWLAAWVCDQGSTSEPSNPVGVYWPEMRPDEGIAPTPRESGRLQKVPTANVRATLDSFVDPRLVTQNGWPHPLAAADHFREAITDDKPEAIRQLELLFAGLFEGELELRLNKRQDSRAVSLDHLVENHQDDGRRDLARYAVVRSGRAGVVMGFTSPETVLCPAPGLPDSEWSRLWRAVTGQREADWKAPHGSWERATSSVRRLRAWIEACTRRHPNTTPPAWTKIFKGERAETGYGGGIRLRVRWTNSESIDVFLPTRNEGPPEFLETLSPADRDDFLREHGKVTENGRPQFSRVRFEIAGEGQVGGIWVDHLRHLQKAGKIDFFYDDADRKEVCVVIWSKADGHRLVTLPGTLLLRRRDIGIRSCTPMEQHLVPGSDASTGVLYPSYPVRWRYFDLLMPRGSDSEREDSVLDVLKRGELPSKPPAPEIDDTGRRATWNLQLRGLGSPVSLAVKLVAQHNAHWMVWPRFHSLDWRAYYVYQHCTDPRIRIDTLWLNREEGSEVASLSRTRARDDRSYPVRFSKRDARHASGPPVALCASKRDDEIGLYLVRLDREKQAASSMQIGIDFGTSHTTAAIKLGDREALSLDLSPELSPTAKHSLSLHVSQNLQHVAADDGPLKLGTWFPHYVKEPAGRLLEGLWPSEILTIRPVKALSGQTPEIRTWEPARDYVIPPAGVVRRKLADHVIANFKWNTSTEFQGRESDLRKIYLDRIVEQALAEAFVRHGRPAVGDDIQFTFTYPLRTPLKDVREYRRTLHRVLEDGSSSLGCGLALHNGVGLFDESNALKLGTGRLGDVSMVGDLGGGTLDLIISAVGNRFQDTADSVKLGGNVVLKLIADLPHLLPPDWGSDPDARFANLAAWVRTRGLTALFGLEDDRAGYFQELGVAGFDESSGPKEGRKIIRRYFFLVGEFMARSLTAYLAKHWLPKVTAQERDRLRIRVYLRGNGWNLWHENKSYGDIGGIVHRRAMKAVSRLWPSAETDEDLPGDDKWKTDQLENQKTSSAKKDVVSHVVGRSEAPERVRRNWFSHTLVELAMVEGDGSRARVDWFEKIPFQTKGDSTRIEFAEIRPALLLSSPEAANPEEVTALAADLTRHINENLREKGEPVGADELMYQAPVAAWVWEAVLERLIADPPSPARQVATGASSLAKRVTTDASSLAKRVTADASSLVSRLRRRGE